MQRYLFGAMEKKKMRMNKDFVVYFLFFSKWTGSKVWMDGWVHGEIEMQNESKTQKLNKSTS